MEKTAQVFRDVIAWQKADQLASKIYGACKPLPAHDRWLVDQVLRCAISVPANIAEGYGRGSRAEFARFLDIARGSLSELEYYLHFMKSEGIMSAEEAVGLEAMSKETGRVLFGLWRSLKTMSKDDWNQYRRKDRRGFRLLRGTMTETTCYLLPVTCYSEAACRL